MRASATQTIARRSTVRTLHVDDDELFASVAAELLEATEPRLSVVTATSVDAGLERLSAGGIDCVVSDYDMPGENGIEFLQRVRERYPRLPFILFTGKGSEEVASDAVSAGVTDYLQKETGIDQYTVLANRILNATEKYWTETDLERRITQQEALATLGRDALEADDLTSLFDEAVQLVADSLDSEYAKVLEWQPERDEFELRAGVGWQDGLVGNGGVPAGADSQAGHTLESAEPIVVTDLSEEQRFRGPDLLVDHDVVSGISVVIGSTDAPWGVLGVHTTDRREFTEQDVTFVRSVANVLAAAIDRRRTETQLRESEARFREIAELSPDGIFRTDIDGVFTYVSPASEVLLGRSADDLVGTPFEDVVSPGSHETAVEGLGRVVDGAVVRRLALTLVDDEGREFDVEVSASPVRRDGEVALVQGFARDVTEQHEREQQLQHSRERFQALVDHFPNGGVFLFDEEHRYTMAGGDELAESGLTPEMMLGRTPAQVFPPKNAELLERAYRGALAGEKCSFEDTFLDRDYHVQTIPLRNEDGDVIAGMAVAQNITERNARERELQESRERYQSLVDNFPGGVFLFGEDLRIIAAGGRGLSKIGMTPEEIEGRTLDELLPDDETAPLEQVYRAALEGEEQSVEYEWRGRNYLVQSVPLRDADGQVTAGMTVVGDVTDRVKQERELEESRERYQTLVDNFPGGVVLFDQDLRIIAAGGTEFERATWDPKEGKGERLRDTLTPEGTAYLDTHYRAALEGETRSFEYETNGTHYRLQTIPLFDGDGTVTAGMAVTQNVTERVTRDRKLAQLRECSQELMYTETREETVQVAVDTARDVVDASLSGFHELNAAGDRLEPEVLAETTDYQFQMPAEYDRNADSGTRDDIVWEAFERGESQYIPDTNTYEPLTEQPRSRSVIIHPIGQHGVFIVAATEPNAFDEADRTLIDILAASLTAGMDRVEREQRLRAREQRLEDQNERLSRFASIVSHDLRSPLSVAQGWLQFARTSNDDAHFDAVEKAHGRMDRLIEGLLQLTIEGDVGTVDTVDLASAARASWAAVETTGASLVIESATTVVADQNRLQQLFENLFRNSVEHGSTNSWSQSDGSGDDVATDRQTLSNGVDAGGHDARHDSDNETLTVTVGALPDGFYVEDDGRGIEPDRRDDVFEVGHSTSAEGTGLGLSIVADIAAEHGWSVAVTNGREGGARFEFTAVDVVDDAGDDDENRVE